MATKSRNLSTAEYFLVVQKEYLITEFRRKIYYSKKDKEYYTKVLYGKRAKIEDIAKRNSLDSIFTNDAMMLAMREELFDNKGKPKFEMTETDAERYYAKGNEFSFLGDIWILDSITSNDKLILYSPKLEQFVEADKGDVIRIL